MHGVRRVVTFCLLTAVLPTILLIIPLYLRHSLYADVTYTVAESDVLEVMDGISTVFCQEQILKMNNSFRAFQLKHMPPLSSSKKHIQLKKSMSLPDDTLEYWGFYVLSGSIISLSACSRYEGARVLVVKGEKNLRTCGLMDHSKRQGSPGYSNKVVKQPIVAKEFPVIKDVTEHTTFTKSSTVSTHTNGGRTSRGYTDEDQESENTGGEVKEEVEIEERKEVEREERTNNDGKTHNEDDLVTEMNSLEESLRHIIFSNESNGSGHVSKFHSSKNYRKVRHIRRKLETNVHKGFRYRNENNHRPNRKEVREGTDLHARVKRHGSIAAGHVLDTGVGHGGNAGITEAPGDESSVSSFEINLRQCYGGQEVFTKDLHVAPLCSNHNLTNTSYVIEKTEISSEGYYYFIFYSDNDRVSNSIHAHFDIYKTTYQHTNYTHGCINQTECRFPITLWSSDIVIVEIPTHDGIEHEDSDMTFLVSSCYPRMAVYCVFPVAVLFLILGCAFL